MTQRYFFSTLHHFSTVNVATATVLAFVLLHISRFNFHCYTQSETMPTQKSARKCAATSHDFLRERLQSAFTLANQLRWITQYILMKVLLHASVERTQKGIRVSDWSFSRDIMIMKGLRKKLDKLKGLPDFVTDNIVAKDMTTSGG